MRKHWRSVRQLSSPGSADRSELDGSEWPRLVSEPGVPDSAARPTLVAGGVRLSDRGERVVLVADEHEVAPDALGLGGDLRNALEHGALEIQLQHNADDSRKPRVHRHREVQGQHTSRIQQRVDGFQWARLTIRQRSHVGAPRWAERSVDGRVVVEQRQEHNDAFGDGRAEPRIEPAPAVDVPPLEGFELVLPCGPSRALRTLHPDNGTPFGPKYK